MNTQPGTHPFDEVEWETRSALITNERGEAVFEQKDVEVPRFWSQLATNIVVQKYFRGTLGTPEREHSVKQLIGRVVRTIAAWGKADGYFATEHDAEAFEAELAHLLLHQKMSFNSPVWFNVGIEPRPQASACFINSVKDTMQSILGLAKTEGMLFKYGSGTGSNLSTIRSSREQLAGGGTASGPVSFMRGYDAFAGVIKSGGKTRRAAKMVILNVDHPDIMDFIRSKASEEKKAWALIQAGYDPGFNIPGGAYDSVFFQNANHSVRVPDEFMKAVLDDRDWELRAVTSCKTVETVRARALMRAICESAWACGDPGLQFDTTINDWNPCINTARINASNPCVTGDTLVATDGGWQRIDTLVGRSARIVGADGQPHLVTRIFPTGHKPVYRLRTRAGYEVRVTADHKILTAGRGDVPACELRPDDRIHLQGPGFGRRALSQGLGLGVGVAVGDGCLSRTFHTSGVQEIVTLTMAATEVGVLNVIAEAVNGRKAELVAVGGDRRTGRAVDVRLHDSGARLAFSSRNIVDVFKSLAVIDQGSDRKRFMPSVFDLDKPSLAAVLRGLFTADGTVANSGTKSQYVALDSCSLELLRQVQLLLLSFGIKALIYSTDGNGGMHSLRVSRSSRFVFEREIGFDPSSPKAAALARLNSEVGVYHDDMTDTFESFELAGEEDVFDLTEAVTSHFVANGIVVHNCSEYMFLDDSACNLASLNLMKFRRTEDGEFDVEPFRHAVDTTILAQEIIVDNASYPTEAIGKNSHDFRPLGLGYANLGALLMARGIPYDSESGRAYGAAITALMCGEAYMQSALVAAGKGPFERFPENREPFLKVIRKHREAAEAIPDDLVPSGLLGAARSSWNDALSLGEIHGFKNAQVTVLAPTGTIAFMMDCDTTGIEPDIALVKYKKLVGGGLLKIVNNTVPLALNKLGYSRAEIEAICDHIDREGTIEGAPHLKEEHLPIFDCAFRPQNGIRSIHYSGHIRMMSAVQPFLSGAISKTVNLPENATLEEIEKTYIEGWKLGLKAIAIYRDGCKKTQPLSTAPDAVEAVVDVARVAAETPRPLRRRLPDERHSITHKFSIAGHEGYITVGMYEDGTPGEIFVTMAKQGSVVSGLMDSFATAISLTLQYGVPLRVLCGKFSHSRFEPAGITNNPDIPFAKSIADYIFRWLALKFLSREEAIAITGRPRTGEAHATDPLDEMEPAGHKAAKHEMASKGSVDSAQTGVATTQDAAGTQAPPTVPLSPDSGFASTFPKHGMSVSTKGNGHSQARASLEQHEKRVYTSMADAPACHECGEIMIRNGSCYACVNCGATSGCS